MATTDGRETVFKEVETAFGQVPTWMKQIPASGVGAFWGLMRDFYLAETRIPNKYKELIGLGISGATRCKYCALFHTEAAKLFGATDEEIAEASLMGAMTMCASTFLNGQQTDYDEFHRETLQMVAYAREHQAQPADAAGKGAVATHA